MKILKKLSFHWLDESMPTEIQNQLSTMFEELANPFSHLSSEYKRLKYFEALGDYIKRETFTIQSRVEKIDTPKAPVIILKDVKG